MILKIPMTVEILNSSSLDPDGMWPDWPTWGDIKNAAKNLGQGAVNFVNKSVTGLKNEGAGLIKAYQNIATNPGATLKYAVEHSGPALIYKAAKGQIEKPINIIKKAASGNINGAIQDYGEHLAEGTLAWATSGAAKGGTKSSASNASTGETAAASAEAPVINQLYKRPNNATTPAQRASVQGKPCVTCGGASEPMVANHKTPLVEEHYETGTIDLENMRSLDAVDSQCMTCSASQGGKLSQYSKGMKKIIEERTQKTNGN